MRRETYDKFILRCDEAIAQASYSHMVPQLEVKEVDDSSLKCMFSFGDQIDRDLSYDVALSEFFGSHEQFLNDMLSISSDVYFQLSVLINVDADLEVFDLKIPRIPYSIVSFKTFEFEYWIWHLRDQQADS